MPFAGPENFDFHCVGDSHLNYLGSPHPEDDDLYIIPFENYSTISFENYSDIMLSKPNSFVMEPKPFEILRERGAHVFFVDEYTTMTYLELTGEKKYSKPTYLVLFDFYDSYYDKLEFFDSLTTHARFILIAMPG